MENLLVEMKKCVETRNTSVVDTMPSVWMAPQTTEPELNNREEMLPNIIYVNL